MQSTQNIALVLVRFLGLVTLLFGILWFVNLLMAVILTASHPPEWISTAIWGYTAQGLLSGPIWFIAGIVLLRLSRPLASFLARGSKEDVH